MKPTVRRARTTSGHYAPGWILTRPPYGFGSTTITRHPSWRAAHHALATQPGTTTAALNAATAGYSPGLRQAKGRAYRPRWIET